MTVPKGSSKWFRCENRCGYKSKYPVGVTHLERCPKRQTPPANPELEARARTPQILVQEDPVEESNLPIFDLGMDQDAPAPPAPGTVPPPPGGGQPGAPPLPPLEVRPIVDVLVLTFEKSMRIGTGKPEAGGPPQLPGPITELEKQQLSLVWSQALVKYAPYLAKYAVEINAVFVTLAVFGPRLLQGREYNKWQAREARKVARAQDAGDQVLADEEEAPAESADEKQLHALGDNLAKKLGGVGGA